MVSKQTTITNATGLHARPASVFVTEAKKFESNVTLKNVDKDSAPVNAKSIMMILAAGLGTGTKIEIACDGPDEQAALDALVALVDAGFGEQFNRFWAKSYKKLGFGRASFISRDIRVRRQRHVQEG